MNAWQKLWAKLTNKTIKGNINDDGTRIYFVPDHRMYQAVIPEVMFRTEAQAIKAGFRRPLR